MFKESYNFQSATSHWTKIMTATVGNTTTGFVISNPKTDVRAVEESVRKEVHMVYNFITKKFTLTVSREIVGERLSSGFQHWTKIFVAMNLKTIARWKQLRHDGWQHRIWTDINRLVQDGINGSDVTSPEKWKVWFIFDRASSMLVK